MARISGALIDFWRSSEFQKADLAHGRWLGDLDTGRGEKAVGN